MRILEEIANGLITVIKWCGIAITGLLDAFGFSVSESAIIMLVLAILSALLWRNKH